MEAIKDLLDKQLDCSLYGNFDEGWKLIQRLLEERPWCNRTKFNAGWYLLRQGKLQEGMELISAGRFEKVFGSGHIGTDKPIYDGRLLLNNENILFHCEGGFGDEIVGIRFCKEIKKRGGNCVVICHSQLRTLFQRAAGVSIVASRNREALRIPHMFWVPSMSSELILGHEFDTLPNKRYLYSRSYLTSVYPHFKTDKIKVGIKWSGNPDFEHEQHRIFPHELMFEAVNDKRIQLYSLQIEHGLILPNTIIDMRPYIQSWEDTAEIINSLDLIITSCTGLAHLSAALGKPTWIIVPICSYYIWAYPKDNDMSTWYYDSARLFRQEVYGSWTEPFDKLRKALELLLC